MKKILYFAVLLLTAVMFVTSCKTTEENYRAAYEVARNKRMETGDSLTDSQLKNSTMPRQMVIGGDTLMVRTEALSADAGGGFSSADFAKYCVVAGQFKQVFNARSMCQRLREMGYDNAFVAFNRLNDYYVMAGASNVASEAKALQERLAADKSITLKAPLPYIMRPGQLVR